MQAPPGGGSPRLTTAREYVIRRGVRFGYCTTNQAPLAEHVAEANETLFKNILHIKQHVLHQLLPDRTQSAYNLRSRTH